MINRIFLVGAILALWSCSGALAALYDNTATDTFNTLFYSVGPYDGIGDQIELTSARAASAAQLQFYNAGGAGIFDAHLRFYEVGAPVGTQLGETFTMSGVESTGSDIITIDFILGILSLPQNVIFVASISNMSTGMDLGVNLFEPPAVGLSDNTFLIVSNGAFSTEVSSGQNLYLRLDEAVPEPSAITLSAIGLMTLGIWRLTRFRRS